MVWVEVLKKFAVGYPLGGFLVVCFMVRSLEIFMVWFSISDTRGLGLLDSRTWLGVWFGSSCRQVGLNESIRRRMPLCVYDCFVGGGWIWLLLRPCSFWDALLVEMILFGLAGG